MRSALPPDAVAVPGFPGYFATPSGDIWSSRGRRDGLARQLHPSLNQSGYKQVRLQTDGARRAITARVHSLVAAAFIGPRPAGLHINHIDAVKTNNAVTNLEYVTSAENARHAARMGLVWRRGRPKHPSLTPEEINAIRDAYAHGGVKLRDLGERFRVSKTTAREAVRGIRTYPPPISPLVRTHCTRGHLLDAANTINRPVENGKRRCRTCRNAYQRKHRRDLRLREPSSASDTSGGGTDR